MLARRIITPFVLVVLTGASLLNASHTGATPLRAVGDFNVLLGRPTGDSVTMNVIPDQTGEISVEYGIAPGTYTDQTSEFPCTDNVPVEFVIEGLSPNTRYYYRLLFRETSPGDWSGGPEYSFHTQRPRGDTFTFTIIADSHMSGGGGNVALYEQTLDNVGDDNPDFHFDLGDTFWTDNVSTVAQAEQKYLAQREWMNAISPSTPIFLTSGNHENEEGWNFDDSPSKALLSVNARKLYYPNPIPDDFYSGNTDDSRTGVDGDHLLESYYAWEWGDALFVVLDPFQYTMVKPYSGTAGGEVDDETVSYDRWDWTHGEQQYLWFKDTIENSDATFKFVFSHHITGGTYDYVRHGAEAAHMFEWGGYNIDETTWGFDTERPGWEAPIHQLMIDNGVSAYFHGHDHEYAYGERDGIVYQLVPSPSMTGYGFGLYSEADPYTIRVLPNSGHLRVTVSPTQALVEYVRSATSGGTNGEVSHSYTIAAPTTYALTMAVDPAGSGTTDPAVGAHSYAAGTSVPIEASANSGYLFDHWTGGVTDSGAASTTVTMDESKEVTAHFGPAPDVSGDVNGSDAVNSTDALIILSCDVGLDTSQFCPMNCGDVNDDDSVNSTDALVILSYDVGMSVPFPVGESGCASNVTPCAGCP